MILRKYIESFVIRNSLTDHDRTAASLQLKKNKETKKNPGENNKVKIKKVNFQNLKRYLKNEEWKDVVGSNEVNNALEKFCDTLNNCIQKSSYEKIISRRKIPLKPWITEAILKSIRNRDRLKLICNKNPSDEEAKLKFKRYRNLLSLIGKQAKNNYYDGQLKKANKNIKLKWKILREAANLGTTKNNTKITKIINEDDEIEMSKDPKKLCNTINQHFATIGLKTAASCRQKAKFPYKSDQKKALKNLTNSLFLEAVTTSEVQSYIFTLKGGSAPGLDTYTVEMLKEIAEQIAIPLAHIFNLSLTLGKFPDKFKESKIIPLFKKGPKICKKLSTNLTHI